MIDPTAQELADVAFKADMLAVEFLANEGKAQKSWGVGPAGMLAVYDAGKVDGQQTGAENARKACEKLLGGMAQTMLATNREAAAMVVMDCVAAIHGAMR